MREIKFRAIDSNNNFIYGLPYTDGENETAYYDKYNNRMCWRDEKGRHCNRPYKNGTLMQYTGYTDKNGVEIYEGDIVKISAKSVSFQANKGYIDFVDEAICKIEYNIKTCSYILKGINCRDILFYLLPSYSNIELIGNIYENSELLNES